jgi:hypothetical protein
VKVALLLLLAGGGFTLFVAIGRERLASRVDRM